MLVTNQNHLFSDNKNKSSTPILKHENNKFALVFFGFVRDVIPTGKCAKNLVIRLMVLVHDHLLTLPEEPGP
jgi:hypothetical protein